MTRDELVEKAAHLAWNEGMTAAVDFVLEEAARVAEAFPACTHGNLATAPYAAAEQASDEIAAAIRAMIPSGIDQPEPTQPEPK